MSCFFHLALLLNLLQPATLPLVKIEATPDGGIQPQAIVDGKGTIHLIYFKGSAAEGDIYYVRRPRGESTFSKPMRVNSTPKSAVAVGSVRGGQLAIGAGGRVHVVWFGSSRVAENKITPLCYARINDDRTSFEPQRNLIGQTTHLDGGASVAADASGHVYIIWHAAKKDAPASEKNRQVWIARSTDEGKTFTTETPVWKEPTGVCPCCSIKAFADTEGRLFVLYRAAVKANQRDVYLLISTDRGQTFQGQLLHPWKIATCPMSTYAFTQNGSQVLGAWETGNQIYFANCQPGSVDLTVKSASTTGTGQKHPTVAADNQGNILLAWTEGTGWQKGGALAWQLFDKNGQPLSPPGRLDNGIPVWGLPSAVATDSGFILFH